MMSFLQELLITTQGDDEIDSSNVDADYHNVLLSEVTKLSNLTDEDNRKTFNNNVDVWFTSLKKELNAEYEGLKEKYKEISKNVAMSEIKKFETEMENIQSQNNQLKQYDLKYQKEIESHKNLVKLLSHKLIKSRDKILQAKCFFNWNLKRQELQKQRFCEKIADKFHEESLKKKIFYSWKYSLETTWKQRNNSKLEKQAQSVCKQLVDEYEYQIIQLKNEICQLKDQNDQMLSSRSTTQDAIKKALMRGVCALNLETMNVLNENGVVIKNEVDDHGRVSLITNSNPSSNEARDQLHIDTGHYSSDTHQHYHRHQPQLHHQMTSNGEDSDIPRNSHVTYSNSALYKPSLSSYDDKPRHPLNKKMLDIHNQMNHSDTYSDHSGMNGFYLSDHPRNTNNNSSFVEYNAHTMTPIGQHSNIQINPISHRTQSSSTSTSSKPTISQNQFNQHFSGHIQNKRNRPPPSSSALSHKHKAHTTTQLTTSTSSTITVMAGNPTGSHTQTNSNKMFPVSVMKHSLPSNLNYKPQHHFNHGDKLSTTQPDLISHSSHSNLHKKNRRNGRD